MILIILLLLISSTTNAIWFFPTIMAPPEALIDQVMERTPGRGYCMPNEKGCCDYLQIDQMCLEVFPNIQGLVKTSFFSFFKLDLSKKCPFWIDDLRCTQPHCIVETIQDESQIPEKWRSEQLSAIDFTPAHKNTLFVPNPVIYSNENDFCVWDDQYGENGMGGVYVNLLNNPERFTGYAGAPSHKIWRAIYEDNCFNMAEFKLPSPSSSYANLNTDRLKMEPNFTPMELGTLRQLLGVLKEESDLSKPETCMEKRVYYRLLSGLHASISIHLCYDYFNQTSGEWFPNLECFIERIGYHPERLQNLYFDWVILLRAITKAAPFLENYDYCTGKAQEDALIKDLVKRITSTSMICPSSFDENIMFQHPANRVILKKQFKEHFRNISRIMDCVGCGKCRLWGKVQVSGMATALKILFSYEEAAFRREGQEVLKRTEIVALLNTFNRFSESIKAVHDFRNMYHERKHLLNSSEEGGGEGVMKRIWRIAQEKIKFWNI